MQQNEQHPSREQQEQAGGRPMPATDEIPPAFPLYIIDVYISQQPVEETPTVESTLDDATVAPLDATEPAGAAPVSSGSGQHHTARKRFWLILALPLALVGSLVGVWYGLVPMLIPATATITLVPAVKTVAVTTTLMVTTSPQANNPNQLRGRLLPSLSLTETGTVATTGTGQQAATAAHGLITFYNALPNVQIIPAGELLTGADGAQIVTDQPAILPAAQPPTDGMATVAAHTLATGAASNLAARDIDAPCCRAYVLAANLTPFTGGQDAKVFPMVTHNDLDNETAYLRTSLTQSSTAALNAQVQSGEILLQPVSCTPSVSSNHQPGDEATQLTVTLTESCQGEAYQQNDLVQRISQSITDAATQQLSTGYSPTGTVQTSILSVRQTSGTTTLTVNGTEAWVYQITQAQCHILATRIAGQSKQQALFTLTQAQGIQAVSIVLTGRDTTLPTDPTRITWIVLSQTA